MYPIGIAKGFGLSISLAGRRWSLFPTDAMYPRCTRGYAFPTRLPNITNHQPAPASHRTQPFPSLGPIISTRLAQLHQPRRTTSAQARLSHPPYRRFNPQLLALPRDTNKTHHQPRKELREEATDANVLPADGPELVSRTHPLPGRLHEVFLTRKDTGEKQVRRKHREQSRLRPHLDASGHELGRSRGVKKATRLALGTLASGAGKAAKTAKFRDG